MVGDSSTDVEFAHRVGARAIQIGSTALTSVGGQQHWHFRDHDQLQKALVWLLREPHIESSHKIYSLHEGVSMV